MRRNGRALVRRVPLWNALVLGVPRDPVRVGRDHVVNSRTYAALAAAVSLFVCLPGVRGGVPTVGPVRGQR